MATDAAADPDELPAVAHVGAGIPASLIHSELSRVTGSRSFHASQRHQQLLRHLVLQTVAGNTGALKEPVLALEVFARSLATFDPSRDTIVRVEARRLRQRLERYYAGEGRDAALEFRLPLGSYVPTMRRRDAPAGVINSSVNDLVDRGEYFLRQPLSKHTLERALERFDAALRESPACVPACVGMGRAWLNLATGWHCDPRPAAEHGAEALQRALALDPHHAIVATRCGRFDQAFALLDDAIARRDPNVMMLGIELSFAELHADPRWAPLLASRTATRER